MMVITPNSMTAVTDMGMAMEIWKPRRPVSRAAGPPFVSALPPL